MNSRNLTRFGAVALLLASLMVLSVGAIPVRGAVDESTGLYGGDLRVAVMQDIDLNPFTATDEDSWRAIPLVYDSLARIDGDDLVPVPWAATGWTISGTDITVTLRGDLEFHDGSAVTAADVVYSYNEYKTLGLVPGDLTVSSSGSDVTLGSATGGGLLFGQGLALPIVKSGTGVTNDAVGSGPFEPVSTTMPVSLGGNPDHFMTPYLSTVTFSSYADTASAAEALLRGNLDLIGWSLRVDEPTALIDVDGVDMTLLNDATVVNSPGLTQLTVGFNTTSADHDLRLALANVLNPILYGQIYPSTTRSRGPIINENTPWYNPDIPVYQALVNAYPRSTTILTPALKILNDAGYVDRDGDGIRENPDGSALALKIVGILVDEDSRIFTIQDSIRDVSSRLGLDITLEAVPSADLFTRLESGGWDLMVASLDTALDPSFLWNYFHSSGSMNYFSYSNATLDTALDDANAALAVADRQAEVDWVQEFTLTEVVAVPVLHFDAIEATSRGVFDGWVSMPGGVNNFWTYMSLHSPMLGELSADVSIVPISSISGDSVIVLVKTVDQNGASITGVSVRLWIGGAEVTSGTTDATGSVSLTISAPTVGGASDIALTAEATKNGYVGDSVTKTMTVRPAVGTLVVSVASSATTIDPDDSATITVTVRDGAGSGVAGAAVSLGVIGSGGSLASLGGSTGSGGTFTTTFTADVGVRTQFRITATASVAGYTDGSGSTSVLAEQRVGDIEPRPSPFFDWGAIIAAIVVLVVIVLYLVMRRR